MIVKVEVVGQSTPISYLTWTPYQASLVPSSFPGGSIPVELRSGGSGTGKVGFSLNASGPFQRKLALSISSPAPVSFFVAGDFPNASSSDGDVDIQCVELPSGNVLGQQKATVRIRKNAEAMSTGERDQFISTMAILNNQGSGIFQSFRDMHRTSADLEAHQNHGFLPWHRCYLLDLERALQAINPAVTLPYWKFDQRAPNLFSNSFMGVPFAPSNPLSNWATDGTIPLVDRTPFFNTSTQSAPGSPGFALISETATIALGNSFSGFRVMEGTPHGAAHVSFDGFLDNTNTAPKDPLFFLLHCNVDRLWAKWQWFNSRFDKSNSATFAAQGAAGVPGARRIGHNILDTMWPWNNVTTSPRPGTAPRTPFPSSSIFSNPSGTPRVGDMIDYQGAETPSDRLGFDYDDVPFDPTFI